MLKGYPVPYRHITPALFGASILSISTSLVSNFTTSVPAAFRFTQPSINIQNASFCNVTVTYTHPGQNDEVHVEAWLPVHPAWNGRLQATGRGAWAAGRSILSYQNMAGAVSDGYAATTTDAGAIADPNGVREWALVSPGNVDLDRLNHFGSVSLNDQVCSRVGGRMEGWGFVIWAMGSGRVADGTYVGHHRKGRHTSLLRKRRVVFLLERLLPGRSTRYDARSGIPMHTMASW